MSRPEHGGGRLTEWLGALAALCIGLAVWQLVCTILKADYVLPTPWAVAKRLGEVIRDGHLVADVVATASATLIGLAAGIAAGVLTGVLLSLSRATERLVYPLLVAIQSVPKIALAPLIITYLGFGLASKVFTVALFAYFPCLVNTLVGIGSANPALLEMHRAFGATRLQSLVEVRLPHAAGQILSGVEVAVSLGIAGVVVSEFLAATEGLGQVIRSSASNLDSPTMFAALVLLTAASAALGAAVSSLHRKLIFWPVNDSD